MASSADIAAQIAQLDATTPTATDVYNNVTTKLGIPDARTRVQALATNIANTEGAIKGVAPSVQGRTQDAIVTDAQRAGLVNMETQPLAEQYNDETKNYNTENTNLGDLLKQADVQSSNEITGYNTKRANLASELAAAVEAEKQAESQRQYEANMALEKQKFAETQRSNKVQEGIAATKAANSGGGGSSTSGASYGYKNGKSGAGGFWFTDSDGNPISAKGYAQLNGLDFNTLLKKMANSGDKGAQAAIKSGKPSSALTWG